MVNASRDRANAGLAPRPCDQQAHRFAGKPHTARPRDQRVSDLQFPVRFGGPWKPASPIAVPSDSSTIT